MAVKISHAAVQQFHEEVTELVGRLWSLRQGIHWVISRHHWPRTDEHINLLAAMVCLAEPVATQIGVGMLAEVDETLKVMATE
ncbi:MAG: hypothetical protein HRU17_16650 [Polyangiaceae bacterium]|nr:hypothetical protein [Polyangiaceae bacterium]